VDRPGWCFHRIASQICERLDDEFRFQIVPAELLRLAECDVAVVFWWRHHSEVLRNTQAKATVLCLYDHQSWRMHPIDICDFEQTLDRSDVLVAANQTIVEQI